MALDARTRSSIFTKLRDVLGDDDANALMSQFPSVEADELVTRDHLRGEIADLRGELRGDIADLRLQMADLRTEMADFRTEMAERFHHQTVWFGSALAAATALLATIGLLG
jgi:hypothetical protein